MFSILFRTVGKLYYTCSKCTYQNHAGGGGGPVGSGCPSTAAPRTPGAHPTSAMQRLPCWHNLRAEATSSLTDKNSENKMTGMKLSACIFLLSADNKQRVSYISVFNCVIHFESPCGCNTLYKLNCLAFKHTLRNNCPLIKSNYIHYV